MVKNSPADTGDTIDAGAIPGREDSPGVENGNPLQYSCLENSTDRASLVGYSPWCCKESELAEHTHTCSQMEEMHVVGKWEGAMQNFYALERQITLPKSPHVHLPRSSLNPVLLGFHGGLII